MRVQAMPDLMIDSFIDDVAKRSNIDPAAAETAVGTILSVIQQEANASTVTQLFDRSLLSSTRNGSEEPFILSGSRGWPASISSSSSSHGWS
jgi:hypothetical protein